jgi:hypothetical protein
MYRTSVRISPDLSKVAVLTATSSPSYFNLHVLRTSDGADIGHVFLANGRPNSVDWSPDGMMLVVVSDVARILDATTLAELYQLSGVTANTPSVAWSSRNLIATQNAVWAPFDYSGPLITWTSPTNWATTFLDSVQCQGTIFDTTGLSPSSPPQYQVNGGSLNTIALDATWHFDFYAHLSLGDNAIRLVATDRAGNPSESTRWVTYMPLTTPTVVIRPVAEGLRLDWSNQHAPAYKIYSSTTSAGPFTTLEGSTADTSFVDTNAGAQAVKFYVVCSASAP